MVHPLTLIRKKISSVVSVGVTIVYLFSNVVAAHAVERNFWDLRRDSAKRMRGDTSPLSAAATEGQILLAQLPKAAPVGWGGSELQAGIIPGKTEKVPFEIGPKTGDWLGRLVMPYGRVNDVYVSPLPHAPMVVHIQDAHGIEEAQKNLAAMMGVLQSEHVVNLVGLEGASGAFSVEPLRQIASPVVTEAVADFFLKKGLIAGPEFAGLSLPQSPVFYGAENSELYTANIQALKDAFKSKSVVLGALSQLNQRAAQLKKTVFSDSLKTFDHHFESYKAQHEKLGDYMRFLVKERALTRPPSTRGDQSEGAFPNVYLLVTALGLEEELDFKEVEAERRQLVEELARQLPKTALEDLVAKSVDHRAGRLGYGDYHRFLKTLCAGHKIRLEKFNGFSRYISYVLLAEKINASDLLTEIDGLETAVQNSLARTPSEKSLMESSRDLVLVTKLLHHEMTVADWAKYEKRRTEILDLDRRLAALSKGLNENERAASELNAEILKPFEDFCSLAVRRNNALAENLLAHMSALEAKAGVLVAGGFHTEGLTQLLRQKQVSYVVVTPTISKVPTENTYLDVLARDPVPLEKLLAGDRIFLVHPVHLVGGEVRILLEKLLNQFRGRSKGPTLTEINSAAQEIAQSIETPSLAQRFNAVWESLVLKGKYLFFSSVSRPIPKAIDGNRAIKSGEVLNETVKIAIKRKILAGEARKIWAKHSVSHTNRSEVQINYQAGEERFLQGASSLMTREAVEGLNNVDIVIVNGVDFLHFTNESNHQSLRAGLNRRTIYIGEGLWKKIKHNPYALAAALQHEIYHILHPEDEQEENAERWEKSLNTRTGLAGDMGSRFLRKQIEALAQREASAVRGTAWNQVARRARWVGRFLGTVFNLNHEEIGRIISTTDVRVFRSMAQSHADREIGIVINIANDVIEGDAMTRLMASLSSEMGHRLHQVLVETNPSDSSAPFSGAVAEAYDWMANLLVANAMGTTVKGENDFIDFAKGGTIFQEVLDEMEINHAELQEIPQIVVDAVYQKILVIPGLTQEEREVIFSLIALDFFVTSNDFSGVQSFTGNHLLGAYIVQRIKVMCGNDMLLAAKLMGYALQRKERVNFSSINQFLASLKALLPEIGETRGIWDKIKAMWAKFIFRLRFWLGGKFSITIGSRGGQYSGNGDLFSKIRELVNETTLRTSKSFLSGYCTPQLIPAAAFPREPIVEMPLFIRSSGDKGKPDLRKILTTKVLEPTEWPSFEKIVFDLKADERIMIRFPAPNTTHVENLLETQKNQIMGFLVNIPLVGAILSLLAALWATFMNLWPSLFSINERSSASLPDEMESLASDELLGEFRSLYNHLPNEIRGGVSFGTYWNILFTPSKVKVGKLEEVLAILDLLNAAVSVMEGIEENWPNRNKMMRSSLDAVEFMTKRLVDLAEPRGLFLLKKQKLTSILNLFDQIMDTNRGYDVNVRQRMGESLELLSRRGSSLAASIFQQIIDPHNSLRGGIQQNFGNFSTNEMEDYFFELRTLDQKLSYHLLKKIDSLPNAEPVLLRVANSEELSPETRLYAYALLGVSLTTPEVLDFFEEEETQAKFLVLSENFLRNLAGSDGDERVKRWFSDSWGGNEEVAVLATAATLFSRSRLGLSENYPFFGYHATLIGVSNVLPYFDNATGHFAFGGRLMARDSGKLSVAIALHEAHHNIMSFDFQRKTIADRLTREGQTVPRAGEEFFADVGAISRCIDLGIPASFLIRAFYSDGDSDHALGRRQITEINAVANSINADLLLSCTRNVIESLNETLLPRAFFLRVVSAYFQLSVQMFGQSVGSDLRGEIVLKEEILEGMAVKRFFDQLINEPRAPNNIVYRGLKAWGASERVAALWGMRLLPLEIMSMGWAGLKLSGGADSLLGVVLPLMDPTGAAVIVMASGLLFFALLHPVLQFIEYILGRGPAPTLRGFGRQLLVFAPYVALPLFEGVGFALVFALAALNHYVFDEKQIGGSHTRAKAVSQQVMDYFDSGTSMDQLARRSAYNILMETMAMGPAGKAIPDQIAQQINTGVYWNLSPQARRSGLTSLLEAPELRETLEGISSSYESSSPAPSLPAVSMSVDSRMATNLTGFSNKPAEDKALSRSSVRGLLGAGQNLLVFLGENETPGQALGFLGIESDDPRSRLIEFRPMKGGASIATILRNYREAEGNIPLANVALNWKGDSSFDNSGLIVVSFNEFELAIQNAIRSLIELMRSA